MRGEITQSGITEARAARDFVKKNGIATSGSVARWRFRVDKSRRSVSPYHVQVLAQKTFNAPLTYRDNAGQRVGVFVNGWNAFLSIDVEIFARSPRENTRRTKSRRRLQKSRTRRYYGRVCEGIRQLVALSAYRNFRRAFPRRRERERRASSSPTWDHVSPASSSAKFRSPTGRTISSDLGCFIIHAPSSQTKICLSFPPPLPLILRRMAYSFICVFAVKDGLTKDIFALIKRASYQFLQMSFISYLQYSGILSKTLIIT